MTICIGYLGFCSRFTYCEHVWSPLECHTQEHDGDRVDALPTKLEKENKVCEPNCDIQVASLTNFDCS